MLLPSPIVANVLHAPAAASSLTGAETRQILIRLGYLPLLSTRYLGPRGNLHHQYAWDFPAPAVLTKLVAEDPWTDPFNPWVLGALYQFEAVHNLPICPGSDGIRGLAKATQRALLVANKADPHPWTWVLVSKFPRPEMVRVFVAGRGWVFRTPCNTGVLHATPNGTWPVYARAKHTQMIGEFPIPVSAHAVHLYQAAVAAGYSIPKIDYGRYHHQWVQYQHYDDPDIRWVNYFFRGRAIHFYPRASYGFPQSAGCVELPKTAARAIFSLLHYGVPVSIVHRVARPELRFSRPLPAIRYQYQEVQKLSSSQSVHLQLEPVSSGTGTAPKTTSAKISTG
ncbi:MAG: L,D-transpeptidase [Acidithiobacillus sp.]|nr:L,D-transpeptidase [Acidithiobacillus sp.]